MRQFPVDLVTDHGTALLVASAEMLDTAPSRAGKCQVPGTRLTQLTNKNDILLESGTVVWQNKCNWQPLQSKLQSCLPISCASNLQRSYSEVKRKPFSLDIKI